MGYPRASCRSCLFCRWRQDELHITAALELEDLRERLAQDRAAGREEKGGEPASQLLEGSKGPNRTGPVCTELAELAEEIHSFIGWPAKQKKQARKDQIAAVRAKA